jgi:ATP-binding cassette subfamily G (WHITE) protein 2 (PDR)
MASISVLVPGHALPGFWKFMYRVSPFTYLVEGMLGVAVANTNVVCAQNELLHFDPPSGSTCGQYMQQWISAAGGYLENASANSDCSFCAIQSTNTFLAQFGISYTHRWRSFGIMWAYIVFNIFAAVFFYWLARVVSRVLCLCGGRMLTSALQPKNRGKEQATEPAQDVKAVEGQPQ